MSTTSYDTVDGGPPALSGWLAGVAAEPVASDRSAAAAPARRTGRGRPGHDDIVGAYQTYHRELLRFATLVAPEDGLAEDLVQEAFVRLYKSWGRVDDHAKLGGYLRTVVLNLARGRGRRLGLVKKLRREPDPDVASAESHAIDRIGGSAALAALRQLPRRQRECLVLRYFDGYTESEIASTLGISVGSARTHLHRGTASLRATLGGAS